MRYRVAAIVPAAGSGKRLKARTKKPFVSLAGRPLITYALKALDSSKYIDEIYVAADPDSIKRLESVIYKYGIRKVTKIVAGGKTRAGSVKNCFDLVNPLCDIVLIHDGARPFPGDSDIMNSVLLAGRFGGCVTAIPMTDTVKLADKRLFIKKTIDRSSLWRAQTPQAFRYGMLKKALCEAKDISGVTDDASILENLGRRVKILKGSPRNIKITTIEDLKIAEVLI
ncbi:MAG: 2-C-methyl-D-erythritol 4-phosphate cytidylyltransferase [Candidatus Omnitrophota bacterium]|jgi:2-C-methyl-D-erythritol 4-phosphate cytidylyltransferase|nr:2-C-methyl-D-erythritol 4-phosphate cytidylyltransferase [Candidatus Omnitrophota bacterium]